MRLFHISTFTMWLIADLLQTNLLFGQNHPIGNGGAPFAKVGLIVVDGTVASTTTKLLVDTGCTTTLLDRSFELSLNKAQTPKRIPFQTPAKLESRLLYDSVDIQIAGFSVQRLSAVAIDLEAIRQATGVNTHGVVGMTYLRKNVLAFSGDSVDITALVRWPKSESFTSSLRFDGANSAVIPTSFPVLGGRDAKLDTGFTEFLGITVAQAEAMIRTGDAVEIPAIVFVNPSGVVTTRQVIIREVEILGARYENVPASVGMITHLGIGFLRSRDITLDFPSEKIIVDSSQGKGINSFPIDASGLRFVWRDGAFFVRRIGEDSAATHADIRANDQLETLNDQNADELSIWAIKERLSAAGTSVRLGLVREGKKIEVTLPLSRTFEYPPKWKPKRDDADGFLKSLEADTAGKKE